MNYHLILKGIDHQHTILSLVINVAHPCIVIFFIKQCMAGILRIFELQDEYNSEISLFTVA